jgi:hypothetical protein
MPVWLLLRRSDQKRRDRCYCFRLGETRSGSQLLSPAQPSRARSFRENQKRSPGRRTFLSVLDCGLDGRLVAVCVRDEELGE